MPRFHSSFLIKATNEQHSTITLDLPNLPNVFHTSEISPFAKNNSSMFPLWALQALDPITVNGQQGFFIDKIMDEWMHGKKRLYRVCWQGVLNRKDGQTGD